MKHKSKLMPYLFIAPSALFLILFISYPLLHSAFLSFTKYDYIYDKAPDFTGLQSYINLFSNERFLTALLNTTIYTFFYSIIIIIGALLLAVLLDTKLKGSSFFQISVFLPIIIPLSLAGVMFVWILNPTLGVLNFILKEIIHLPQLAQKWLGNPSIALYSLVGMGVWKFMGFSTILFLAGLGSLPKELHEVSLLDGANWLQELIFVKIPNLKESFFLVGFYAILQGFKVFALAMVSTGGGPGISTLTLYLYVYRVAFGYFKLGRAAAAAYILAIIILVLTGILKYFTQAEKR